MISAEDCDTADRPQAVADGQALGALWTISVSPAFSGRRDRGSTLRCAVSDIVRSSSVGAFRRSRPPFQRLRHGLPVWRTDIIEAHQAISRRGLKDLDLPCRRSISRPLLASADSRLFQAVGRCAGRRNEQPARAR